jgi:hypothetical protein
MQLTDVRVRRFDQQSEISASVGGMRLWYRVPVQVADAIRVDAFLVAALMPAMVSGEDLEVSPEFVISSRLYRSISKIQDILHVWNPQLKKVRVHARCGSPPEPRPGSACLFSGGIDSMYTCLKHRDEITHLILLHGLDIAPEDERAFSTPLKWGREVAERLGKTLVVVQTNGRDFCNASGLAMALYHGALLASVSLLLGFGCNYVAASQTYDDLEPWGSHVLLDPLWSTESSEIIYDGCEARRIDKVRDVAQYPELLSLLRVCTSDDQGQNCGHCEKCLRTMAELRLVGASSSAFPHLSPGELRKVRVNFDTLLYYIESYEVAQQIGDAEMASALSSALRRFETRQILKHADTLMLGGWVGRLLSALRRQEKPALLRPRTPTRQSRLRTFVRPNPDAADIRQPVRNQIAD